MAKKVAGEVRDHSEERKWLLNLGAGNILAGIQNLIQQAKDEQTNISHKKKTGR